MFIQYNDKVWYNVHKEAEEKKQKLLLNMSREGANVYENNTGV